MADNYVQFSETLDNLTPEETRWLRDILVTKKSQAKFLKKAFGKGTYVEPSKPLEFDWNFGKDEEGKPHLWVYAMEYGNPEHVAVLVQDFLRTFRPHDRWVLSYADTCSQPRIANFDGGAVVVTAEKAYYMNAREFALNNFPPVKTVKAEEPFSVATVGGLCEACRDALMPGAIFPIATDGLTDHAYVERCDACRLFVDDVAAAVAIAAHLGETVGYAHKQPYIAGYTFAEAADMVRLYRVKHG